MYIYFSSFAIILVAISFAMRRKRVHNLAERVCKLLEEVKDRQKQFFELTTARKSMPNKYILERIEEKIQFLEGLQDSHSIHFSRRAWPEDNRLANFEDRVKALEGYYFK